MIEDGNQHNLKLQPNKTQSLQQIEEKFFKNMKGRHK
jgi:hypothetical protein